MNLSLNSARVASTIWFTFAPAVTKKKGKHRNETAE